MRKVNVLDSKIVFDDFYRMEEATFQYELTDGTMTEPVKRLCFHRDNSVAGVVFNTDTQKAMLVRQFRYSGHVQGDSWITEVVAGMLKDGHEPEDEMKREVLEEIGYETAGIRHISTFYVSPGGCTEKVYLYYVEVNEQGRVSSGGGLDEEAENIEIIQYSIEELREAMANDDIPDAKSIIGCNYLLAKLAK